MSLRLTAWQRRALESFETSQLLEEVLMRIAEGLPPGEFDPDSELAGEVLRCSDTHDLLWQLERRSGEAVDKSTAALMDSAREYRDAEDVYAHAISMHGEDIWGD